MWPVGFKRLRAQELCSPLIQKHCPCSLWVLSSLRRYGRDIPSGMWRHILDELISQICKRKTFFARNSCSHGYIHIQKYNSTTLIFYFYVAIICVVIRNPFLREFGFIFCWVVININRAYFDEFNSEVSYLGFRELTWLYFGILVFASWSNYW
jgi:hypothetical protein